ncbi:hypothetical protein H8356DRAFT_1343843 [Neocallimastix lanati (nom. inval.)]|nr:hypothetical protein H8356DRAFT_1343843 [Neocallimastix sp. JGI-2020a]
MKNEKKKKETLTAGLEPAIFRLEATRAISEIKIFITAAIIVNSSCIYLLSRILKKNNDNSIKNGNITQKLRLRTTTYINFNPIGKLEDEILDFKEILIIKNNLKIFK